MVSCFPPFWTRIQLQIGFEVLALEGLYDASLRATEHMARQHKVIEKNYRTLPQFQAATYMVYMSGAEQHSVSMRLKMASPTLVACLHTGAD